MPASPHTFTEFSDGQNSSFLPNFCHTHTFFAILFLAQLLAFIIALIPATQSTNAQWQVLFNNFLHDLALISLFIYSIAISSSLLLCWLRCDLERLLDDRIAGIVSYGIILLITLSMSELAWELERNLIQPEPIQNSSLLLNLLLFLGGGVLLLKVAGYFKAWRPQTLFVLYAALILTSLSLSELAYYLALSQEQRPFVFQRYLFIVRNLGISAIISAIALRYTYIYHDWKRKTLTHSAAKLQALQSRIRPHFLFNSLNAIVSLIPTDPEKAEQVVMDLADLFRTSMLDVKQQVTLYEEIEFCEQYLRIERIRLGEDRLKVIWQIDNVADDALIPALCLQPLLENAIYYGIQPAEEGGTIYVTGLFDEKMIWIIVENPILDMNVPRHAGNQMAQKNINERLKTTYGANAGLSFKVEANTYQVSIRFPYCTRLSS